LANPTIILSFVENTNDHHHGDHNDSKHDLSFKPQTKAKATKLPTKEYASFYFSPDVHVHAPPCLFIDDQ
jgi:hypothetical protein